MINVEIVRDSLGKIASFTVENHGQTLVCAAVSMLVLNTINSIEKLTDDDFTCEINNRQSATFSLTNPESRSSGIEILIDAMFIGLSCAKAEHPDEIEITEVNHGNHD
ncbi:MAG: ribosomal-processing cysteine protease Prp [Defluviitaleaceae bacterium]|nr:ribosomal-processing cysteine protease Prp [Defluviitaleaceae bacterium]